MLSLCLPTHCFDAPGSRGHAVLYGDNKDSHHPISLDRVACVNECCDLSRHAGQANLIIRQVYGNDQIRYLRCRVCRLEFSERKHTALWNTKVREAKAVSVGAHLAEGCSLKDTARR